MSLIFQDQSQLLRLADDGCPLFPEEHAHQCSPLEDVAEQLFRLIRVSLGSLWHSRNMQHDAQDLAQEAFLRLIERHRRGCPVHELSRWARLVTRDVQVEFFRRLGRRTAYCGQQVSDILDIAAIHDVPEQATSNEITALVRQALAKLDEKIRLVVIEIYFERREPKEVAEQCGITLGSIRHRLREGRQALRQFLSAASDW